MTLLSSGIAVGEVQEVVVRHGVHRRTRNREPDSRRSRPRHAEILDVVIGVHLPMPSLPIRVTVEFSWRELGGLFLSAARILFPDVPAAPGIYRLTSGTASTSVSPTN